MASQRSYSSLWRSAGAFLLGAGFAVAFVAGITGASLSLLHHSGMRGVDRLGLVSPDAVPVRMYPVATTAQPGLPG